MAGGDTRCCMRCDDGDVYVVIDGGDYGMVELSCVISEDNQVDTVVRGMRKDLFVAFLALMQEFALGHVAEDVEYTRDLLHTVVDVAVNNATKIMNEK